MHRRGQHHRTGRHETTGGEQVIGPPLGQPGHEVGGGRGDHHEIGLLPQPDVLHLVDRVEDRGGDRVARQGLERRGTDELQGRGGRDDVDVMPGLRETPDEGTRLVGGDTPADADEDLQAFAHVIHGGPS